MFDESISICVIRATRANDADAILGLFESVAAERLWIGTEPGFDRDAYRARTLELVTNADSASFVACEDDRIVGQIAIHPHTEYGHALGILIEETSRGRGLGRRLMEAAIAWAKSESVPTLSLLVFPHNEAAIALYTCLGFTLRERYANDVVRHDGQVWDTLLMVLEL